MTEQQNKLKINICKKCIHSRCGSSFVNKCSEHDLVCNIDNSYILNKLNNSGICPKGYWNFINRSGGCGCGG